MEQITYYLKQYKKTIGIGLVVACIVGVLMANFTTIQVIGYMMQKDTVSIMQVVKKDAINQQKQDEWYFIHSIEYLLEEASQESLTVLEDNFEKFLLPIQQIIVKNYNEYKRFFATPKSFMMTYMANSENQIFKSYLKRIDPSMLDAGLFYYFGQSPKVDSTFITQMNQIATVYPEKLLFEQFTFSIYELLHYKQDNLLEEKNAIIGKINPEKCAQNLFIELKTKSVTIETLRSWVEMLNKNNLITSEQYASFTTENGEVVLLRKQYKDLKNQEVTLNNEKDMIKIQLGEYPKQIQEKQKQLETIQSRGTQIKEELETLTDYSHMALYITKTYGNGEYEASIPKKSMFGNYKPSSQKFVLKLNTTDVYQEGVYYVDVYLNGTKQDNKGKERTYYVEVSKEQLDHISTLQNQLIDNQTKQKQLKQEVVALEEKLEAIKQETGYYKNQEALMNLDKQRKQILEKLQQKSVIIQNIFGIGKVIIKEQ